MSIISLLFESGCSMVGGSAASSDLIGAVDSLSANLVAAAYNGDGIVDLGQKQSSKFLFSSYYLFSLSSFDGFGNFGG